MTVLTKISTGPAGAGCSILTSITSLGRHIYCSFCKGACLLFQGTKTARPTDPMQTTVLSKIGGWDALTQVIGGPVKAYSDANYFQQRGDSTHQCHQARAPFSQS